MRGLKTWAAGLALAGLFVACGGGAAPDATGHAARMAPTRAEEGIDADAANRLMDYAERAFPAFFPGHPATQSFSVIQYRYYPLTGTYLGVATSQGGDFAPGAVYVLGGIFGTDLRHVGSASALLGQAGTAPAAGGAGASVPFQEYYAADAETNGVRLGPSRTKGEFAAEAVTRRAVQLTRTGDYISFRPARAANSIVVRYSIPDAPGGGGDSATLGVYVDGVRVKTLNLTSRYTWLYGDDTNSAQNDPSAGVGHHLFDEAHALLPMVNPGSTVTLQRDATDSAAFYVVDLIDLELVAPALAQPAGSISAASYGAVANGVTDDTTALQLAITAARSQGKVLWLPSGTYKLDASGVDTSGITIQGAGMWYTVLQGRGAHLNIFGNNNVLRDFALFGDVTARDDTNGVHDGIRGPAGTGSLMENLWIEHVKAGIWISRDPNAGDAPQTTGLVVRGLRVRNTFADGVNLAAGTSSSVVQQSSFRNTGDDAVATWSPSFDGPPGTSNTFEFNTVQAPWKANCFAIYGGGNHTIQDNLCMDVYSYPGILISSSFNSWPFAGRTTVQRNTLLRTGGMYGGAQNGAFEIIADQGNITGLEVRDLLVLDSTYQGIMIIGPHAITESVFDGIYIDGASVAGIMVAGNASGSITARNVVVSPNTAPAYLNHAGTAWSFPSDPTNLGW
jgi:hypothetical protein